MNYNYDDLNPEERYIIDTYRMLPDADSRRAFYKTAIDILRPKSKGEPIHFPAQPK